MSAPPQPPGYAHAPRRPPREQAGRGWWIGLGGSVLLLMVAVGVSVLGEGVPPAADPSLAAVPPPPAREDGAASADASAPPLRAAVEPKPAPPRRGKPAAIPRGRRGAAARAAAARAAGLDEADRAGSPDDGEPDVVVDAPPSSGVTRPDVIHGIAQLKPRIARCFHGTIGQGVVRMVLGAGGRVTTATVSGIYASTPTGQCISAAATDIGFPGSARDGTTVVYPFVLRGDEDRGPD